MNDAPEKLYYSISEVSEATAVKAHVLRYWESQFPMLRPRKSRGGMRMYRSKDAALIQRIKYLLYDRGFTIAGARRKLFEDRRSGVSYDAFEPEARAEAYAVREEAPGEGPGSDPLQPAAARAVEEEQRPAAEAVSARQLELTNSRPAVAPAGAGPLQEIRAEIEALQAMMLEAPRLKIRT